MTPAAQLLLYGPSIDADAKAWARAVIAAGSTVTRSAVLAVSRETKALKATGLWDKVLMALPCAGNNLTAALVRLKVPTGVAVSATNNNFTAAAYTEATGITGDGATQYLGLGINPITRSYSTSSFGLWAYTRTAVVGTGTSRNTIGSGDAAGANLTGLGWINSGAQESGGIGRDPLDTYAAGSATSVTGFLGITANGSRVNQFYRNGAAVGATGTMTDTFANREMFAHALNLNGSASGFCNRAISSIYITTGLSAAEAVTFNSLVQAFESALARNV
jgi:hypothetical protein